MKQLTKVFYMLLVLTLIHASFTYAQNEKKQSKETGKEQFCPIAYGAMDKAVKGDPKFSSTYKGKTYFLANAEAKKMFDADPAKYIPKYDGYCATAFAMGKKVESDPHIYSNYKNSTYLFSNKMAKEAFDKNPEAIIKNADKNLALLANK